MKPPALSFDASLAQIAQASATPEPLLRDWVARRGEQPYRVFRVRKRSGGWRSICVPCPALMQVQRFIHRELLRTPTALAQLGDEATAYRPGGSPLLNAQPHLGSRWLLKLDVRQFFESVSERQVWHVFRRLGYTARTALLLARLCTRVLPLPVDQRWQQRSARWTHSRTDPRRDRPRVLGHLPQGAPTSPMLANLVCVDMDAQLRALAHHHALAYTRYADDLAFSGAGLPRDRTRRLIGEVARTVGAHGFGLQQLKTQVAAAGARRIVTGVAIEGEQPRLPRAAKDALRQALHHITRHGLQSHCERTGQADPATCLHRLAGQIHHLRQIEPEAGERLMRRMRALAPAAARA